MIVPAAGEAKHRLHRDRRGVSHSPPSSLKPQGLTRQGQGERGPVQLVQRVQLCHCHAPTPPVCEASAVSKSGEAFACM